MTDRPIPGIDTIRCHYCFISSRGVVRAMQMRGERERIWRWMFDWMGW